MILLDTNVVSAMMRAQDNSVVIDWIDRQASSIWMSVITIYEIRYGIALLPRGRKAAALLRDFETAIASFGDNILDFDVDAAEAAAFPGARRKASGLNIGLADTQIAGIAISCNATVATRNVKDFAGAGCAVLNPFVPQA